jgi:predicted DNA-binding transcriptional regulator YafY
VSVIDSIKQAGREKKLLKIQYKKLNAEISERVVEPYKITDGRLYAWDVAKSDHIRNFLIIGILTAQVLPQTFTERNGWDIEIA